MLIEAILQEKVTTEKKTIVKPTDISYAQNLKQIIVKSVNP